MAQWTAIEHCHKQYGQPFYDRIGQLYDSAETKIPLLVRERFAPYIESINWGSVSCETDASQYFSFVVGMVTEKEGRANSLVEKSRWRDTREQLHVNFGVDPMLFVAKMDLCLQRERMLIQSCASQAEGLYHNDGGQKEQPKQPDEIRQLLCQTDSKLKDFQGQVESLNGIVVGFLSAEFDDKKKRQTFLQQTIHNGCHSREQQMECQALDKYIKDQIRNLQKQMERTIQSTSATVACTKSIFEKLQQANSLYVEDQRMMITGLGSPREGECTLLNNQCTEANDIFLRTVNQIDRLLEVSGSLPSPTRETMQSKVFPERTELFEAFDRYFKSATVCTLTKQILKVTTERSPAFRADVRIFGGCKLGFDTGDSSKVSAKVYKSEDVESKVLQGTEIKPFCRLDNSEKRIEVDLPNKSCVAVFDKLMLRNVREKSQALKGSRDELVWEQKYQIVFTVGVKIKDWNTTLKCVSPMFAIISNPSQEIAARGSIIWKTAFPDRTEVEWREVANLLSSMFLTFSGRGLEPPHLSYLAQRVFKHNNVECKDFASEIVTYEHLFKKSMSKSKKNFTFWKWISCCLNTVAKEKGPAAKDWVRPGVIMGFASRDDVANKLRNACEGTAIIRFSESKIDHDSGGANPYAALNVGFRYVNQEKNIDDVYFTMETLDPSVSDSYKLKTRGLGLILRSFIPRGEDRLIQYIYPDLPMDRAFPSDELGSPEREFTTSSSGPCVEAHTALNLKEGQGHFALHERSQQTAYEALSPSVGSVTSRGEEDSLGTLSPGQPDQSPGADPPFPVELQDLNLGAPFSQTFNNSTIPVSVQEGGAYFQELLHGLCPDNNSFNSMDID